MSTESSTACVPSPRDLLQLGTGAIRAQWHSWPSLRPGRHSRPHPTIHGALIFSISYDDWSLGRRGRKYLALVALPLKNGDYAIEFLFQEDVTFDRPTRIAKAINDYISLNSKHPKEQHDETRNR